MSLRDRLSPVVLRQLTEADIVFCVNVATGERMIYHGLSLMKLIAAGLEGPAGLATLVARVALDYDTDEPEELAALCLVLKGHTDAVDTEDDGTDEGEDAE
jgi:hypothetical protein